jgi:hypothetical protein
MCSVALNSIIRDYIVSGSIRAKINYECIYHRDTNYRCFSDSAYYRKTANGESYLRTCLVYAERSTRRGRSVHVVTGGCKGGSQVFLSFILTSLTFVRHLYHIYHQLFSLLTSPLCMLNAYHITPTITISYSSAPPRSFCAYDTINLPRLLVYNSSNSPSSSRFINFVVLGHVAFIKLLSHQQGSFPSPWCCPTVSARLPTCVCLRATQMWRLSGPSSLPLLISLGAKPGP